MDMSLDEIIRSNPSEYALPPSKQRDKEFKRNRSKWERIDDDENGSDNEEDMEEMPELLRRNQFPKPKVSSFEIDSEEEEEQQTPNRTPFSQSFRNFAVGGNDDEDPVPDVVQPLKPEPPRMQFTKPLRTCETSDEEDSEEEPVRLVHKPAPRKSVPDNLVFSKPRRTCEDSDEEDEDEADNVGYPALAKEAMMAKRKTLKAKIVSSGYGRTRPATTNQGWNSPFVKPMSTLGNSSQRHSFAHNSRSNHGFHHRNQAGDDDDDEPISISMYDNGIDEDQLDRLAGKKNYSGAGMKRKYADIWGGMNFDDGPEDVQMEEDVQDLEVKASPPTPTYGKRHRIEHSTPPTPKRDLDPVECMSMSLDEIIRRREIKFTEQPGVYDMDKEKSKFRVIRELPMEQLMSLVVVIVRKLVLRVLTTAIILSIFAQLRSSSQRMSA